jgi:hypothetical protein
MKTISKLANITSNLSCLILLAISCMQLCSSCNRDDDPSIPEDGQNSQENNTSEGNTSGSSVNYYFRVETQVGNLSPEAGSLAITFDCNQSWTVSYSGDISGFSYTPSSGKGGGRITIKYGEVNYKQTSSEITWNEHGTLMFHIREGNSANFKNTTYNVYLSRRGSKQKV